MTIDLEKIERIAKSCNGISFDTTLRLIKRLRQAESERDALQKRIYDGIKLCHATNASEEINRAYKSKSHKTDTILISEN